MDTRDLPEPVVQAVLELGGLSPADLAKTLRDEARWRGKAALVFLNEGFWEPAVTMFGLALGYLAAAARAEEHSEAA